MFISVIICTHNRAHLLKRTLRALSRQTIQPKQFEIIVVDDGSDDDTAEVCDTMSEELPNMRYIGTGERIYLANASNLGVRSAKSNYILFTDDDCIPKENWVERMSAALEREPIVAGAVASPVSNYVKLCHNIAQFRCFMPGRRDDPVEFIAGANMGFRRSVLEELNGFEGNGTGTPDTEFILRARQKGYRITFASDAVVIHDPDRTTLSSIFRHASEHASETILLRNRYRKLLRTPFVLRSPLLILLAAPLIALKVTMDIYMSNFTLAGLFWTMPLVYALKLVWCWGAARGLRSQKKVALA